MKRKVFLSLNNVVLLLAAFDTKCHALAHSCGRIISRKSDGQYVTYSLDDLYEDGLDGPDARTQNKSPLGPSSALLRVRSALRSTFLPSLPSGQGEDGNGTHQLDTLRRSGYLSYIFYDNIQDLSTSLRSVLATQRILEGVGVGRAGATALSATLNFLIRDGCGMAASLLFTSYASRGFRRDVKRWKFFADIMVDFGITLEILAPSVLSNPLLSGWFLPLLCLGNVCKALCGVAAGACGGALQMHWAMKILGTEEGISEVAAKSGAQRTVVGGAGLILSALVAKWLGGSDVRTAIGLYCLLTLMHLFTNHRSLKLVALDWLNNGRLHLVVDEFLECVQDGGSNVNEKQAKGSIDVSNPVEVSRKESLFFLPKLRSTGKQTTQFPIRMGISFNEFSHKSYMSQTLLRSNLMKKQNQRQDNYMLSVGRENRRSDTKLSILVSYFSPSNNSEKAKVYLHCCLISRSLASLTIDKCDVSEVGRMIQKAELLARSELDALWPIFERSVTSAGWKLDKTECFTEGYELYFDGTNTSRD